MSPKSLLSALCRRLLWTHFYLKAAPRLHVPPVLQGQPQSCGIGFIFAHQHAHPLGVAFAFFQGYGQEVILGFEVLNTATKEEKSLS